MFESAEKLLFPQLVLIINPATPLHVKPPKLFFSKALYFNSFKKVGITFLNKEFLPPRDN